MLSIVITVIVVCAIVTFMLFRGPSCPTGTQLPPGPKGRPFVGSLFDIPERNSFLWMTEMGKKYGPICSAKFGRTLHVYICKQSIANDLLSKRGEIYNSRDHLPVLGDEPRMVSLPYGPRWRAQRRLAHALLGQHASLAYVAVQQEESVRMLRDLIHQPEAYEKWFGRYAAAVITRLAFSEKVITGEETILVAMRERQRKLFGAMRETVYISAVPFFERIIPVALAPHKRVRNVRQAEEREMVLSLQAKGLEKEGGKYKKNFTTDWFLQKETFGMDDLEAAYTMGVMYEAASTTTATAETIFLLAMTSFPDAFRRMQDELDRVVADRLPVYQDSAELPICRATLKESMRWWIGTTGVPHFTTKDDIYEYDKKRYFIPKGTVVHPVIWAMSKDEELFPEAEQFFPERYLEPKWPTYQEPLSIHPNLTNNFTFGFGRRICPGQHIAEQTLFIFASRLAWACRISKKRGENGDEISPTKDNFKAGQPFSAPAPFEFELKPRLGREKALEKEWLGFDTDVRG